MYTYNEIKMNCKPDIAFRYASQVEAWPQLLPHYRHIKFHRGSGGKGGLVEMAAVRPFKPFNWPVWWMSEMNVKPEEHFVGYTHIQGVTRGMEVEWRLEDEGDQVKVSIIHKWDRPPLGRRLAAAIIGHMFVHVIADRTLQGLKLQAEAEAQREAEVGIYG